MAKRLVSGSRNNFNAALRQNGGATCHLVRRDAECELQGKDTDRARQLAIKENAKGFNENQSKAIIGGKTAGELLGTFEERTGLTVVSSDNFLGLKGGDKPDELPPSDDIPKK